MPHIELPDGLPGILGPIAFRPDTVEPLNKLADLDVKQDTESAGVSDKLKALLAIAGKVQSGGKNVLAEDIERARLQGATDLEIHDTVLIAAAFCMYNRYADRLATWAPQDAKRYRQQGARHAEQGYAQSTVGLAATR